MAQLIRRCGRRFYALRGFYFAQLASNMVEEAHRLAPRIEAIALASNDLLLLHHSWIVRAITYAERGEALKGVGFCDRIRDTYRQQQTECPTPYVVNPFAPMCPVVWAMGTAVQILAFAGHFADILRRSADTFALAEEHNEPVAYQETIYHELYANWYLEVPTAGLHRYWDNVRTTGYQMASLQLECLMALQVNPRERWEEFKETADKVWAKFCAGAQFLLTLSMPLLQLLLSAGMWREGLVVVERWKARTRKDGWMDGCFSDCLRFQAQFLLLQAHERLTEHITQPTIVGANHRRTDSPHMRELIDAVVELRVGITKACERSLALMEAKCLLTSIYIQQLLLHIDPFPSSQLPFSQLMAPPHVELERPFKQWRADGETLLVGVSVEGLREQQASLAVVLVKLEANTDETVQSSFFQRAKRVAEQRQ